MGKGSVEGEGPGVRGCRLSVDLVDLSRYTHRSVHPFIQSSMHPFFKPSIISFFYQSVHLDPPILAIRPCIHASMHPFMHPCIHAAINAAMHLSIHPPSIHPSKLFIDRSCSCMHTCIRRINNIEHLFIFQLASTSSKDIIGSHSHQII